MSGSKGMWKGGMTCRCPVHLLLGNSALAVGLRIGVGMPHSASCVGFIHSIGGAMDCPLLVMSVCCFGFPYALSSSTSAARTSPLLAFALKAFNIASPAVMPFFSSPNTSANSLSNSGSFFGLPFGFPDWPFLNPYCAMSFLPLNCFSIVCY